MPQLLWDASALVKRYYAENGSPTVHALFTALPGSLMVSAYMTYAETAAILRRKFNRGDINLAELTTARLYLENEVLYGPDFELLSIEDADVLSGIGLSDGHNINSTDAAILAAYLGYARSLSLDDPVCVLIAADERLLRAAALEGLRTLNPETLSSADVTDFLTSLPL